MSFDYKIKDSVLIVELSKEIDHHNAEMIRKNIDKIIDANYIHGLVLDFKETRFIDSSGIGVVMGRYNHMKNLGGKVGLININRNTDKLFRLSGIYSIMESYSDIHEAVCNLK